MTGAPLVTEGAVQVSVARAFPGATEMIVGAPGGVGAGVTLAENPDYAPTPTAFTAATLNR